ncbi:hypothetical protein B5M06_01560 [Comamonas kerstersii]|uniref:Uncharacterized protein n=1 Tax=Comamonas kerstersii TaxID=225992 RepID=A0A1V0BBA7_9BURK|nr:hypothetical protein [Comamonas kerstersii]AQZ97141.1 hypothetical protein B5M06_01560 [Comamonas kerstersii]
MAEVTRRRTGELLRELFHILMADPEGVQASAALQALASKVQLRNLCISPQRMCLHMRAGCGSIPAYAAI